MTCSVKIPTATTQSAFRPAAIELGLDIGSLADYPGILLAQTTDPTLESSLNHIHAIGSGIIRATLVSDGKSIVPDSLDVIEALQATVSGTYTDLPLDSKLSTMHENRNYPTNFRKKIEAGAILMRFANVANGVGPESDMLSVSSLRLTDDEAITRLDLRARRDSEVHVWGLTIGRTYVNRSVLVTRLDASHQMGQATALAHRPPISIAYACSQMIELLAS